MNLWLKQRDQKEASPERRRLLKSLSAGVLGFSAPEWLAMQAHASNSSRAAVVGQAKRVLVIYEEGGISQMDSFDPKTDALLDHRSPFKPIPTSVPGTHFSELMPLTGLRPYPAWRLPQRRSCRQRRAPPASPRTRRKRRASLREMPVVPAALPSVAPCLVAEGRRLGVCAAA